MTISTPLDLFWIWWMWTIKSLRMAIIAIIYGSQLWTVFVQMRHSDLILFFLKSLEFTPLIRRSKRSVRTVRTIYLLLFRIYFGIFLSDYVTLIFCIYILIFSFRIDLISFFRPFLILKDRSNLSTLIRVLFLVCSFLWSFIQLQWGK